MKLTSTILAGVLLALLPGAALGASLRGHLQAALSVSETDPIPMHSHNAAVAGSGTDLCDSMASAYFGYYLVITNNLESKDTISLLELDQHSTGMGPPVMVDPSTRTHATLDPTDATQQELGRKFGPLKYGQTKCLIVPGAYNPAAYFPWQGTATLQAGHRMLTFDLAGPNSWKQGTCGSGRGPAMSGDLGADCHQNDRAREYSVTGKTRPTYGVWTQVATSGGSHAAKLTQTLTTGYVSASSQGKMTKDEWEDSVSASFTMGDESFSTTVTASEKESGYVANAMGQFFSQSSSRSVTAECDASKGPVTLYQFVALANAPGQDMSHRVSDFSHRTYSDNYRCVPSDLKQPMCPLNHCADTDCQTCSKTATGIGERHAH